MYEIRIEDAGQEILHQVVAPGRYHLGRSEDNDIHVANPNVSRQHLELVITDRTIQIRDLGSTNGTVVSGRALEPYQFADWPIGDSVQIGRLSMRIWREDDQPLDEIGDLKQPSKVRYEPEPSGKSKIATILCPQAEPPVVRLTGANAYIGKHSTCTIRLSASDVASHHCLLQPGDGTVTATNLDPNNPARLEGKALAVGQPVIWEEHHVLQIGSATLHLSYEAAGGRREENRTRPMHPTGAGRRSLWGYGLIAAGTGILIFICLLVALLIASNRAGCGSPSLPCVLASLRTGASGDDGQMIAGASTPTLAAGSTGRPVTNRERVIEFSTETPVPTMTPVECLPVGDHSGWLELPFPYEGIDPMAPSSPEQFRRISQRTRFGGRINSFFDHEFPVYPPNVGGREPSDRSGTLVTFNGGRSVDAFTQDSDSADWYSGHPGIDFAPAQPRQATTPVLAAADGKLIEAKIDSDGNHLVRVAHDPDGDGFFQYATYYYHLAQDEYFTVMLEMEEGSPITARQRIGTMGTTGRSSGIHLHFEVRFDANRNGFFTLYEAVDPYGFFPSEEIPVDPWSISAVWIDTKGTDIEHRGITSEYLWIHPLVAIDDEAIDCVQAAGVQVDLNLYPVLGYAVVNPGFTYIARNAQGEVIKEGPPQLRRITILPEYVEGVDIDSIGLEYLDPELDVWFSVNEDEKLESAPNGGYTYSATIRRTGRYVLVARETVDRVAPVTKILLEGTRIGQDDYSFDESVVVSLDPVDRGLITSDIVSVQYSLDCGASWITYDGPFRVSQETPHACGEEEVGLQGIEFSEEGFLLLAISEDSANNIEQPPSQARFNIK